MSRRNYGRWAVVLAALVGGGTLGATESNSTAATPTTAEPRVPSLPKKVKSDKEACRIIAAYANSGSLRKLIIPTKDKQPSLDSLSKTFGREQSFFGHVRYWNIDMNEDGIRDHLVMSVEGTMSVGTAYALSGKKGADPTQLSDYDSGYFDLSLLAVGQKRYVLSGHDETIGRLSRMTKSGEFQPVCSFSQRSEPLIRLVLGQANSVCLDAQLGRLRPVEYSRPHSIGPLPNEERFWSKGVAEGSAQVDINNDGRIDNVVRVGFAHGGGRGCSAGYVAVTDDARAAIPDTSLNRLLLDKLGGHPCGPDLDVFVHRGTAYVDAQGRAGNRVIYQIASERAERVCEFQGRSIHDAVVP